MCDVLIPALIGLGALGLLGGGIGGNACGNSCDSGYSITIPQEVGQVTNGIPTPMAPACSPMMPSYPQAAPAPYAGQPGGYYGAPAPAYPGPGYAATSGPAGVGADVQVGNQSLVGVNAGADNYGTGVGANVGPVGVGVGARSY